MHRVDRDVVSVLGDVVGADLDDTGGGKGWVLRWVGVAVEHGDYFVDIGEVVDGDVAGFAELLGHGARPPMACRALMPPPTSVWPRFLPAAESAVICSACAASCSC